MSRRIITTENLEEDKKIENHLRTSASGGLYRPGESKRDSEDLY